MLVVVNCIHQYRLLSYLLALVRHSDIWVEQWKHNQSLSTLIKCTLILFGKFGTNKILFHQQLANKT